MFKLNNPRPLSCLALAVCPLLAVADSAEGFIEGSHLNLVNRVNFLNTQVQGDGHDRRPNNRRDPKDLSYGLQANFSSGFTQGTLGIGFDAFAYSAFKLDGGDGHTGYGNIQVNDRAEAKDTYGRTGGSIKLRYGQTQLRFGEMQVTNPVFATADPRLFPSTATGIHLSNQDIAGLLIEGGHFTAGTEPASTSRSGELWATYANVTTRAVDFAGGRYAISDHWNMSLYGANYQDLWRQAYVGTDYGWAVDGQSRIDTSFNLYRSLDQGQAKAGDINTTAFSTKVAYTRLNHKLSLSYQQIHGDTPMDYVGFGNNGSGSFGNSIYLDNPVMVSDFNGPNEKSWQLRYDLDMAPYGYPGLSFMARYVYGYDIKRSSNPHYQGWSGFETAEHQERDLEARYVVQSGVAKGLRVRLRQGVHNAKQGQPDGDITMHIIALELPVPIF